MNDDRLRRGTAGHGSTDTPFASHSFSLNQQHGLIRFPLLTAPIAFNKHSARKLRGSSRGTQDKYSIIRDNGRICVGTPLYVYDEEEEVVARCRAYAEAFGADAVAYAAKAFLCGAMARIVAREGLALDVATGGEAFLAQRAGFPPSRMVFHGNDKSENELRTALTIGVGRLVVDSFDELDRIEGHWYRLACARHTVLVRVPSPGSRRTPTITSRPAPTTRSSGSRWQPGPHRDAAVRVAESDSMELVGLHCHIGSQILLLEPFAAEVVAELAAEVARITGEPIDEINLGGGLGVAYTADDTDAPSIVEYAAFVRAGFDTAYRTAGSRPRATAHSRGRSVDRRPRRGHALHRRHHQGDPIGAHVCRGRRWDERQPAPGHLRHAVRGVRAHACGRGATVGRHGRGEALRAG